MDYAAVGLTWAHVGLVFDYFLKKILTLRSLCFLVLPLHYLRQTQAPLFAPEHPQRNLQL